VRTAPGTGGNATRALLPALGVLALVAIVAIAAAGSTPSGSNAFRLPGDSLLDAILTFVVIAAIPALLLYWYGILYSYPLRSRRMLLGSILGFAGFILVFILLIVYWYRRWYSREPTEGVDEPGFGGSLPPAELPRGGGSTYEAEFSWIAVFVLVGLAGIAALAFLATYVAVRRARAAVGGESKVIADALADALDDSLDDLRAEADPRRAVIAAYARLERVLAAHEFPRLASETPDELLARLLPGLDVGRRSISRLTDLFTWAKFSHHDVDSDMKEEAIAALGQVRDELRASAEQRELQRLRLLRAGEDPA
jgi:hypothetical protein